MNAGRKSTVIVLLLVLIVAQAGSRDVWAEESVPTVLVEKHYLYEVARHLYRWYLDEKDLDQAVRLDEVVFWVRELHPKLDQGDRSRFGEIVLPQLGITVKVKAADYMIEELDSVVKNDTFKIANVTRGFTPKSMPPGSTEVKSSYPEMKDYLFRTRNQVRFPEDEQLMRMRLAVREKLLDDIRAHQEKLPSGEQIVHLSALSPIANEVWVFWETGRLLIRFSSDIDLANPLVWAHDELAVDLYDIDEQVVVSLDEVAGSNAYLTRDQVGRALFNCVVLGRRLVLQPLGGEIGGR